MRECVCVCVCVCVMCVCVMCVCVCGEMEVVVLGHWTFNDVLEELIWQQQQPKEKDNGGISQSLLELCSYKKPCVALAYIEDEQMLYACMYKLSDVNQSPAMWLEEVELKSAFSCTHTSHPISSILYLLTTSVEVASVESAVR